MRTRDPMVRDRYLVDNRAGFRLAVTRFKGPGDAARDLRGRPVLFVPGYGMNSFVLSYHPRGPSLVECLVARGLEVWTMDLRGQGGSVRGGAARRYDMADLAIDDVGAALRHVLATTATGAKEADVVGCSLGAALAFGHLACVPEAPVHAVVSMAGVVSWRRVHPLVRALFGSPRLAGLLPVQNTRHLARVALPVLARLAPGLLAPYVNPRSSDLREHALLVQTVEDPTRRLNRELAEWIARGDLVLRGVNVSRALASMTNPLMCVVGNDDGIVPPETARFPYEAVASTNKRILAVGDAEQPIAHADLFLFTGAQERVFTPIADFLLEA